MFISFVFLYIFFTDYLFVEAFKCWFTQFEYINLKCTHIYCYLRFIQYITHRNYHPIWNKLMYVKNSRAGDDQVSPNSWGGGGGVMLGRKENPGCRWRILPYWHKSDNFVGLRCQCSDVAVFTRNSGCRGPWFPERPLWMFHVVRYGLSTRRRRKWRRRCRERRWR